MTYTFRRSLGPYVRWTQEWLSFFPKLMDVLYTRKSGITYITLKFREENVIVTDIEDDGTQKVVFIYSDLTFALEKDAVDDQEAKKLVLFIKKIARLCGAKLLDL
ncbi:MAG: hypothetical protein KGK14_10820 [Bacteroidota bacterium]|nr:hypothetical protein [Bacteroidota bacterium]